VVPGAVVRALVLRGAWLTSGDQLGQEPPDVGMLESFLDAFNRHDIEGVMAFFAEDCVFETPRGPDPWGRRLEGEVQVREGVEARFAGIPDIHYGKDRHWVFGDRGVSEWTITGTDTSGKRIEVQGCDLFEFREGKIARKDSYWKIVA
jgi:steroid delta-isomerase-like uncharacterized protein